MQVCKRDGCNNEVSDKATWCSDACRKAASRTNNPDKPRSDNPDKRNPDTNPDKPYTRDVTRTNPELINTGPPMAAHQLKQAGLKANRVPIPGDWDYEGVCEKVDGVWKVGAA